MRNGLNHFFRVVWNAATGTWQAIAECGKGHGKTTRSKSMRQTLVAGSFVLMALPTLAADVLPTGGNVVAGALARPVSINNSKMTIEQSSNKLAMDWQTFSIGKGNTVEFIQPSPSAIALNRVLGSDVSVIQGALKANGQVFLVNPNGVLFSPTAQVDVGSLIASTQSISTNDFLAGNYVFSGVSSNAIINQGNITAVNGGTIALIAAKIINDGALNASQGNVLMGAGSKVTLDLGGPVKLQIANDTLETLIANGGAIHAEGGHVLLTSQAARTLASSVINHSGLIEAQALATGEKGEVILFAHGGKTQVNGTINATGGFVETSGKTLDIANGTAIKAKQWLLDPQDLVIDGGTGAIGGDTVGASVIESTLNAGTNVTLQADNSIQVNHALTWQQNSLQLQATKIDINQAITLNGSANLVLVFRDANINKEVLLAGDDTTAMLVNYGGKLNFKMNADKTGFDGKLTFTGAHSALLKVDVDPTKDPEVDPLIYSAYSRDSSQWGQAVGENINTVFNPILNTRADLETINATGSSLAGNYLIGQDIDLSGKNWTPIGTWSTPFQGQIDGLGHIISNMTIRAGSEPSGLVGTMTDGRIANLALKNASITGTASESNAGLLIGYAQTTANRSLEITNIITQGSIQDMARATGGIAGQIGNAENSTITLSNVHADVRLRDTGDYAGGLVGSMGVSETGTASTLIENSSAHVHINNSQNESIGGLVGVVESNDAPFTLRSSYATGHIEGRQMVGGLIGELKGPESRIETSFSNVEIGLASSVHPYGIGGLVGHLGGGTIENSYARGAIYHDTTDEDAQVGGQYIGGFVGYSNNGSINRSYADVKINLSASDFTEEETGYWGIGGLVGSSSDTSITNSAALGDISIHQGNLSGDYIYTAVGGLIGVLEGGGTITNNLFAGTLTVQSGTIGPDNSVLTGGIIGGSWLAGNGAIQAGWNDSGETVADNQFDGLLNPSLSGQTGITKTAKNIAKQQKAVYDAAPGLGFDFSESGPWRYNPERNDSLPYLKWAEPLFASTDGESGGATPPAPPAITTPPEAIAALTAAQTAGLNTAQPTSTASLAQAQTPGLTNIPSVVTTSLGNNLPVVDVAGGLAFVQAPAGGAALPSEAGGIDPMGFMRVFVVGGGLSMPRSLQDDSASQRRN